jgi:uroporphyrinogen decarboxylase
MTARERFKQICRFERPNDPYMWSIAAWSDTYKRWYDEGMPVEASNLKEIRAHLLGHRDRIESIRPRGAIQGMTRHGALRWIVALDPMFEPEVISETEEHVVEVDFDGAIVERKKQGDASIPRYIEYPVKDKKTWDEYKKKLDPFSPGRWPEGWEIMTEDKLSGPLSRELEGKHFEERDFPLGMNLLSLYGNPRNYMGLENLSYAIFDNIALVEEMIEWQAYLAYEMAKKVFEKGVTLDWVWIWEDMAFKNGPLVSPAFVRRYMAPRYRKVVDLLRSHGVEALILDCDGNIDELLPIWIDCGINATYPLECAAGMDGRRVREKYGNNIILIGNVDKQALAKGKKEIDAEIVKVKSLLRHGGYFPNVDHHIPPDVPYENMVYFLNELRKLSDYEETRRFI